MIAGQRKLERPKDYGETSRARREATIFLVRRENVPLRRKLDVPLGSGPRMFATTPALVAQSGRATDYRCEKTFPQRSWLRANTLSSRGLTDGVFKKEKKRERDARKKRSLPPCGNSHFSHLQKFTGRKKDAEIRRTANSIAAAIFSQKLPRSKTKLAVRGFIYCPDEILIFYITVLWFHLKRRMRQPDYIKFVNIDFFKKRRKKFEIIQFSRFNDTLHIYVVCVNVHNLHIFLISA